MNNSLILEIKQIIKHENLNIYLNLPDELLIQEFKEKVRWWEISEYHKLSENFIRKFQDKIDWGWVCMKNKLSEDFIFEFYDKVDWFFIGSYQKLSEKFILKYWNKLDHKFILKYQNSLTPAFLLWLYKTYQNEEYNLLKYKNDDFKEYALKIEEEVKIVMIEIM